ncbi:LysE family translocator [Aestuariivirga sp. YIM B02566]|uniref:LysE family transporter n=1 Tax=Taklimakanibacter albus TaxID=2800327 RepID=A0ACC5RCI1_9HYPH|nr:LysE family transporter [Aestuariivirga sp. YIM B02566]MBK1870343.1 LysE family transporter [Aestuariivirga sp. YIM B02566]
MDPELIAIGMAIGIAVTAPLGPVNLTVIRSALRAGMAGGMAAASGSIAGDALFATLAAYGVRWVEDWVHAHSQAIQIVGGLLLIFIGVRTAMHHVKDAELSLSDLGRGAYVRKGFTCFFLTVTNPGALLGFFAIFSGLGGVLDLGSVPYRPLNAVVGVILGTLLWWGFVTYLVTHIKGRVTSYTLVRLNIWAGVAIAVFGVVILGNLILRYFAITL